MWATGSEVKKKGLVNDLDVILLRGYRNTLYKTHWDSGFQSPRHDNTRYPLVSLKNFG